MSDTLSPRQRSLDDRLRTEGTSLAGFLEAKRAARVSWRMASHDLHTITGEYIADETLRRWYAVLCDKAAA